MKSINTTTFLAVVCLTVTGCSRLQMNKQSELSFYDPFADQTQYQDYKSSHYSDVGSPAGSVRLTDIEKPPVASELYGNLTDQPLQQPAEVPAARYPEVVDTNMQLAPYGADNAKPTGASDAVPADLRYPGGMNNTDIVSSPVTPDQFGEDPFTTAPQQFQQVAAVNSQLPGSGNTVVTYSDYEPRDFVEVQPAEHEFVHPADASAIVETVSVPVSDSSPGTANAYEPVSNTIITSSDEIDEPVRTSENTPVQIGWRKTR